MVIFEKLELMPQIGLLYRCIIVVAVHTHYFMLNFTREAICVKFNLKQCEWTATDFRALQFTCFGSLLRNGRAVPASKVWFRIAQSTPLLLKMTKN